jgi:O-antigen ligase
MYLTSTSRPWNKPSQVALVLLIATVIGYSVARAAWLPLVGALGLSLLMIWPAHLWLGVFVFLVPFDDVSALQAGAGGLTLTSLIGLVALFVLLATAMALHRFRLPSRQAFWWFAFISWAGCTVLWSVDRDIAMERLPTMINVFFFYLIVTCCHFSEKEVSQITRLAIFGGCVAACIALYEFRSGIFYRNLNMRGSLVFGDRQTDPNIFAASLLLPLALVAGEFLGSAKWRSRFLLSLCALLIASGIFVTTSRGALLAIVAMALVYMRKLGINWRVLAPLTLLGGALLMAPEFLFKRLGQAEASGGAGRVYIWQTGVAALKDYFFAGAGLDNFAVIYNDYAAHAVHFAGLNRPAHNVFLQIAVELGAIGCLLFACALISPLRYASRREAFSTGSMRFRLISCEAAAYGMLVAAFFLGLLWTKAFWIVWIMLAICSRAPRMDASEITPVSGEPKVTVHLAQDRSELVVS